MRSLSKALIGLTLGASILTPIATQAQERGRGDRSAGRSDAGSQGDRGGRGDRSPGEVRQAPQMSPRLAPQIAAPAVEARNQDQGRQRGDAGREGRSASGWNRGGNAPQDAQNQARQNEGRLDQARPDRGRWDQSRPSQNDRRDERRDVRNDQDGRNDRYRGNDRYGRDDRSGRNDRRLIQDGRGDSRRDWRADNRNWNGNDRRNWSRDWRDDRRYGWQDYRSRNDRIYRLPRYVAPRYGYNYRRWSPGYRVDPWFYGSSYWISDPFYYRLPPAYGDYRWVRYFDDVALVDIRTGEIVDIIYSFFLR